MFFYQGPPNKQHKKRTDGEKKLENKILLTLDIHAFGLDNMILKKKIHYLHIYTQYFEKALHVCAYPASYFTIKALLPFNIIFLNNM